MCSPLSRRLHPRQNGPGGDVTLPPSSHSRMAGTAGSRLRPAADRKSGSTRSGRHSQARRSGPEIPDPARGGSSSWHRGTDRRAARLPRGAWRAAGTEIERLEGGLRGEVAELRESGLSEDEAFLIAVRFRESVDDASGVSGSVSRRSRRTHGPNLLFDRDRWRALHGGVADLLRDGPERCSWDPGWWNRGRG